MKTIWASRMLLDLTQFESTQLKLGRLDEPLDASTFCEIRRRDELTLYDRLKNEAGKNLRWINGERTKE